MTDLTHWLNELIQPPVQRHSRLPMREWFQFFKQSTVHQSRSIERAMMGGRLSPLVSYAFASGYQSAIEHLFKLNDQKMASLCVTEEKGNHPRAIETTLTEQNGQLILNGQKKFVSGGCEAELLYVACKTGTSEDGVPQLKVICLPADREGINITSLPTLPFVPEVSHGAVSFNDVIVTQDQILPGDGYTQYIKPFRTCEDLHVCAAILAYRLGEAINSCWGTESVQAHLAMILALNALADMPLDAPATHIALAGCRSELSALLERTDSLFEAHNSDGFKLWVRDKALLSVAGKAHVIRTEKAWQHYC